MEQQYGWKDQGGAGDREPQIDLFSIVIPVLIFFLQNVKVSKTDHGSKYIECGDCSQNHLNKYWFFLKPDKMNVWQCGIFQTAAQHGNADTGWKNTKSHQIGQGIDLNTKTFGLLGTVLFASGNFSVKCVAESGKEKEKHTQIWVSNTLQTYQDAGDTGQQ